MRPKGLFYTATLFLLAAASGLYAQDTNDHVAWELLTPEISGKPGETVQVTLALTTAPGAHIYSFRSYEDQIFGPLPTVITAGESTVFSGLGTVTPDVPPVMRKDPNFADMQTESWDGKVTLTIPVRIADDITDGDHKGWVNVNFMTRTDENNRPPSNARFEITVRVKRA